MHCKIMYLKIILFIYTFLEFQKIIVLIKVYGVRIVQVVIRLSKGIVAKDGREIVSAILVFGRR